MSASVSMPLGGVQVGYYDRYEQAQAAVDYLSDEKFPVENVTIIGSDLRQVETVTGRLPWGRAGWRGERGAGLGRLAEFGSGRDEHVIFGPRLRRRGQRLAHRWRVPEPARLGGLSAVARPGHVPVAGLGLRQLLDRTCQIVERLRGILSALSQSIGALVELIGKLRDRYALVIEERRVTREDVVFKLPAPLA